MLHIGHGKRKLHFLARARVISLMPKTFPSQKEHCKGCEALGFVSPLHPACKQKALLICSKPSTSELLEVKAQLYHHACLRDYGRKSVAKQLPHHDTAFGDTEQDFAERIPLKHHLLHQ